MRRFFRTAAFAAGAFGFCAAAGLAGPSIASEAGAAPAPSYIDHAGSTLPVVDLAVNDFDSPALGAGGPELPVATHALAPVLPESPLDEPAEADDDRSLSELVADLASAETPDAETECLARAVYYESKGEPLVGQLTVADVVVNRAESGRFPSTICGVVRQPRQFSFVRGGHIPEPPETSRHWRTAVAIARIAMQDLADGQAPRALFFHARHVRPGWRLTRVATVGNHIFYR